MSSVDFTQVRFYLKSATRSEHELILWGRLYNGDYGEVPTQEIVDSGRDPRVFKLDQDLEDSVREEGFKWTLETLMGLSKYHRLFRDVTTINFVREEDDDKEQSDEPFFSRRQELFLAALLPNVTTIQLSVSRYVDNRLLSKAQWLQLFNLIPVMWPAVTTFAWDTFALHFLETSLSLPRKHMIIRFLFDIQAFEDPDTYTQFAQVARHLLKYQATHFQHCLFEFVNLPIIFFKLAGRHREDRTPIQWCAELSKQGVISRLTRLSVLEGKGIEEGKNTKLILRESSALLELLRQSGRPLTQLNLATEHLVWEGVWTLENWLREIFAQMPSLTTIAFPGPIAVDLQLLTRVVSELPRNTKRLHVHELELFDDSGVTWEWLTKLQTALLAHPSLEQVGIERLSGGIARDDQAASLISQWLHFYLDGKLHRGSIGLQRAAVRSELQRVADSTLGPSFAGSVVPLLKTITDLAGIGQPLHLDI